MRTIYFLRSFAIILLAFLVTNVTAKEIKVSGTDADFAEALENAEHGDVIIIDGWIEMENPVTVSKNVTIKGIDDDCGFDGLGMSKILEIAPEAVDGQKLVFESLGFFGGYNEDDGGVGRIISGTTDFIDCYFEENQSKNRGGVFYVAEDGTTVNFKLCTTDKNLADGNGEDSRGGFIFATGNVNLSFDYCKIQGNQSPGARGGAFYLEGGNARFFYTVISGNQSGTKAEEGQDAGEKGGAAITTAGSIGAVTLESCAVVNNIANGNHGAAFFVMGEPNITVINTTIANNTTRAGAGSWFLPTSNVDITLVNVTMYGNIGTNSGNAGGGFRVMNPGNRINFFNTIALGNTCDNDEGAIEMKLAAGAEVDKLVFKNSIIGLISDEAGRAMPAAKDNPNIPTKSKINMYKIGEENAQPDWVALNSSGLNTMDGLQATSPFGMRYYTLSNGGYATTLGDPALLADLDVTTDALLVERKIAADGSIYAGAIQAITEDEPWDDPKVNIETAEADKQDIRVIELVSNGTLGIDFGDLKGFAKGNLYSISGQLVENVFTRNVIGKGYYNVHVAPGIYILHVQIDGKSFAKRVVVSK